MFFVSGIVSIQLIGTIVWLIIEIPDVREIHPQPLTAVLTCRVSTFSLIMSLVFNMILITLCTVYAFKTRKIPENFNEAKYIGFTMYSTCIVWLAFLPIYFGTNNDYKVRDSPQIISNWHFLSIHLITQLILHSDLYWWGYFEYIRLFDSNSIDLFGMFPEKILLSIRQNNLQ